MFSAKNIGRINEIWAPFAGIWKKADSNYECWMKSSKLFDVFVSHLPEDYPNYEFSVVDASGESILKQKLDASKLDLALLEGDTLIVLFLALGTNLGR